MPEEWNMSGNLAVSQIPWRSRKWLPPVVQEGIIQAKNQLRQGTNLVEFQNNFGAGEGDGAPLPRVDQGCVYYEFDVGETRLGGRGAHRLVFEVNTSSGEIRKSYYTSEHYTKGSFVRIQ
jgi:guanyl-specific ribonuclease Sa